MAGITKEWECSCGTKNSLRNRRCTGCGEEIPTELRKQIYKEELRYQKELAYNEELPKMIARYKRQQELLEKGKFMLTVLIVIIVIFSAVRISQVDNLKDVVTDRGKSFVESIKPEEPKKVLLSLNDKKENVIARAEFLGDKYKDKFEVMKKKGTEKISLDAIKDLGNTLKEKVEGLKDGFSK